MIDASTAHRVAAGWVYGFPEMDAGQTEAVRTARRVTNPGCYPTGAIALIRPLVEAGLLPADYPFTVNAVSGYSGGGRSMIEAYEAGDGAGLRALRPRLRAQARARAAEIRQANAAADVRALGRQLSAGHAGERAAASRHAAGQADRARPGGGVGQATMPAPSSSRWFPPATRRPRTSRLEPEALNGTDVLELRVFASDKHGQAVLVARLDNLGKGASGAAVQNMGLMLGVAT